MAGSGFTRLGFHELRPMPDHLLTALNPQIMVTVGVYKHEDPRVRAEMIDKHRARVQHLRQLLPNALIGVRWWPDDNILDQINPQDFASAFFPLHVPGSVLFVGNEDANSHTDPAIFARTVARHTEVVRLATAAGIPIGTCCMSTGNPARAQYSLYLPLLREMYAGRQRGVYHWLRFNRYRTATDDGHLREHEAPLQEVCKWAGLSMPPIIIGELGAVRSYAEPERGYLAMGWGDEQYGDILRQLAANYPYPSAIYSYGAGVFDERWRDFAATDPLITYLTASLPRTPRTALEEWKVRNVVTPPAPLVYKDGSVLGVLEGHANVRLTPSSGSSVKILDQLYVGDPVRYSTTLVTGGEYRAGGRTMNTWIAIEPEGFVASGVISIGQQLPAQDAPIKSLDVPFVSQLGTPGSMPWKTTPKRRRRHWITLKRQSCGANLNSYARTLRNSNKRRPFRMNADSA